MKIFFNDVGLHIDYKSLNDYLVNDVIASAEIFRILIEVLFEVLLGTPWSYKNRKSVPLYERSIKGVFDVGVASYLNDEEQGRGSLHGHGFHWGAISPLVLQKATNIPLLKQEIVKGINKINCGQILLAFHLHNMVNHVNQKAPFRGIHLEIPNNSCTYSNSFDFHVA